MHSSPSSPARLVHEFHLAFGLDTRTTPTEVSPELAAHRGELLAEEAAEVAEVAVAGWTTTGLLMCRTCCGIRAGSLLGPPPEHLVPPVGEIAAHGD